MYVDWSLFPKGNLITKLISTTIFVTSFHQHAEFLNSLLVIETSALDYIDFLEDFHIFVTRVQLYIEDG